MRGLEGSKLTARMYSIDRVCDPWTLGLGYAYLKALDSREILVTDYA